MIRRDSEIPVWLRLIQVGLGLAAAGIGMWYAATHFAELQNPAGAIIFVTCLFVGTAVPSPLIELAFRVQRFRKLPTQRMRLSDDGRK